MNWVEPTAVDAANSVAHGGAGMQPPKQLGTCDMKQHMTRVGLGLIFVGDCVAIGKAGDTANVRRGSAAYCEESNKAAVKAA